ncbi:MAG TPA: hydrogenase maturation protease, partial [Bacteroidota bacterium]|nr:hydrogenase maturation protease [Bacteroidota bacterium]
ETQHRSTHGIGLSSVIELAHGAGNVPSRLIFYGIAGESFDHSEELTPAVQHAVVKVADLVVNEIEQWKQ